MHAIYDAPAPEPTTLDLPFYGASFGASVRRFFRKYAVFTGRASRSESGGQCSSSALWARSLA